MLEKINNLCGLIWFLGVELQEYQDNLALYFGEAWVGGGKSIYFSESEGKQQQQQQKRMPSLPGRYLVEESGTSIFIMKKGEGNW